MPTYTPRLKLIKPNTEGEAVDIAQLNLNFDSLDSAIGGRNVTSTTRPGPESRYPGQLIRETDTGALRMWTGSTWAYIGADVSYVSHKAVGGGTINNSAGGSWQYSDNPARIVLPPGKWSIECDMYINASASSNLEYQIHLWNFTTDTPFGSGEEFKENRWPNASGGVSSFEASFSREIDITTPDTEVRMKRRINGTPGGTHTSTTERLRARRVG